MVGFVLLEKHWMGASRKLCLITFKYLNFNDRLLANLKLVSRLTSLGVGRELEIKTFLFSRLIRQVGVG